MSCLPKVGVSPAILPDLQGNHPGTFSASLAMIDLDFTVRFPKTQVNSTSLGDLFKVSTIMASSKYLSVSGIPPILCSMASREPRHHPGRPTAQVCLVSGPVVCHPPSQDGRPAELHQELQHPPPAGVSPCLYGASQPALQVLVQEPYGLGNAARAITAPKHWRAILGQLGDTVQLLAAQPGASLQQLCRRRMEPEDTVTGDRDLGTAGLHTAGPHLEDLDAANLDLEDLDAADLDLEDLDEGDLDLKDLDSADLDLADFYLGGLDLDSPDTDLDTDLYLDLEW